MVAERPLGVGIDAKASPLGRAVFHRHMPDLHRLNGIDGHAEPLHQAAARMLEPGVALAMTHLVARISTRGRRGEAPAFVRVLIDSEEQLARWVERRIVGPGREAILLAVFE